MTKIFYDLEFNEIVTPMDLISIGMVTDHGDEIYLINDDLKVIHRAARNPWLMKNVLRQLPVRLKVPSGWEWNYDHDDIDKVFTTNIMAKKVKQFVLSQVEPELWAYYGAYDHVILCRRLFGTMLQLPQGFPMFTNDIMTFLKDYQGSMPWQEGTEHNALEDARHNLAMAQTLGIV